MAKRLEPRSFKAPEGYKRLAINIPEDLHRELKQMALDEETTVTDIVVSKLHRVFTLEEKNALLCWEHPDTPLVDAGKSLFEDIGDRLKRYSNLDRFRSKP